MNDFITRNVVLDKKDEEIVARKADREGFGPKGFSMALRTIIREWAARKAESIGKPSDTLTCLDNDEPLLG